MKNDQSPCLDMTTFLGENERSVEVQQALQDEFDLAIRLFNVWARVEPSRWLRRSNLNDKVLHVAMTLGNQAVRLFRSVIEECRRAEGMCGLILSRTLYETSVALDFVMAPTIHIRPVKGRNDKSGKPKYHVEVVKRGGKSLSREFRATLYMVSTALQEERQIQELSSVTGLRRFARSQQKKVNPKVIAAIERTLGPEWTSILREKSGYSGLSIAQTARLTGRTGEVWYKVGYAVQCRASHAAEAWKYITVPDGQTVNATPFSDDSDIRTALYAATGFFLKTLLTLQTQIGFGIKNVLSGFDEEATKLYRQAKA